MRSQSASAPKRFKLSQASVLKFPSLPPRTVDAEQIDGGELAGIHAPLLADLGHPGNDIGDVVEKLIGEAEIDACRFELRGLVVAGAGQDAAHLGGGSVERRTFQEVASQQAVFLGRPAVKVLTHVVDLAPDHHSPARLSSSAALTRALAGTDGLSRLI